MIIWEVKVDKAVIRMTDGPKAQAVADLINSGGLYEAVVTDSRGPRKPAPKTKATVKAKKK